MSLAGRLRIVTGALVATVVAVFAGWLAFSALEPGRTDTTQRSTPAVLRAVQDLATYTGASGSFQVLVDSEKEVNLVPSFIAGERTLLVATGNVDAQVDFSALAADTVTVSADRRAVDITLPRAQLARAELDNSQTYVAERQRGLVDRIGEALSSSPGDDHELMERAEQQLHDAAAGTELRQRAEDNTRNMLTGLLGALGFDTVTVHFQDPVQS
jgi:hypothetical protein